MLDIALGIFSCLMQVITFLVLVCVARGDFNRDETREWDEDPWDL